RADARGRSDGLALAPLPLVFPLDRAARLSDAASVGLVSDTHLPAALFRAWRGGAGGSTHALRMGDLRTLCGSRRLRAVATARRTRRHRRSEGGGMSDEALTRRYFDHVDEHRTPLAEAEPVCLYLETTNRCNLLCTTC